MLKPKRIDPIRIIKARWLRVMLLSTVLCTVAAYQVGAVVGSSVEPAPKHHCSWFRDDIGSGSMR